MGKLFLFFHRDQIVRKCKTPLDRPQLPCLCLNLTSTSYSISPPPPPPSSHFHCSFARARPLFVLFPPWFHPIRPLSLSISHPISPSLTGERPREMESALTADSNLSSARCGLDERGEDHTDPTGIKELTLLNLRDLSPIREAGKYVKLRESGTPSNKRLTFCNLRVL